LIDEEEEEKVKNSSEIFVLDKKSQLSYRRMKGALNAFCAYGFHYYKSEWEKYIQSPSPATVNALYNVAYISFIKKIFLKKKDTYDYNNISAITVFVKMTHFANDLMHKMNLEIPRRGKRREWKLKFPNPCIF